jgi:hypothetical protein
MSPESHRRAIDVFHELRELPEPARPAVLASCGGNNVELRSFAEELLDALFTI